MADRESYLYQAKLAEQAERYEEMVQLMTKIAQLNTGLTIEERNLLSVGYKNVIGTRRASWRVVTAIESKERGEPGETNLTRVEIITKYRGQIEKELVDICIDILGLLDATLLPSVEEKDTEARIFYQKMKADYYRYMCEIMQEGEKKASTAGNSLDAYKAAYEIAEASLPATHPIRLGLALNFSVFYYEILNQPDEARVLAQRAFDNAVKELSGMSETDNSYKDSTLILQLLRDNLTLWSSEDQDEGETQEPVEDQ